MSTSQLSRPPTPLPGGTSVQSTRPGKKLTDAEKGSRAVRAKPNATKSEALTADIEAFLRDRDAKLREIAAKHSKRVDYVKHLVLHSPVFKAERAPNIHNTIVHLKTMEVNAGRAFFY